MKPVAIFIAVAAFAALSVAAQAETVNAHQAKTADDRSVAAVAGPDAAAHTAGKRQDRQHQQASGDKDAQPSGPSAPARPKHQDPN